MGVINSGFAQKVPEQRLSQEIETYIKNVIKISFEQNVHKLSYLKKIEENNGSTKAPYELLFIFTVDNVIYDVYADFKPINILKNSTAPFMGSIHKYISRLKDKKYYDVFLIVEYESEVNKLPVLKNINLEFVKDITNFSLYNNWQLQLSIKNTKINYGRLPECFKNDLIKLLEKMKTNTVNQIISRCDENIKLLKDMNI